MDFTSNSDLDRKIDYIERKILLNQDRLLKQKQKFHAIIKRLERQLRAQEEVKKEWIRKINLERERIRVERNDNAAAHRHNIDDLRLKFEMERANKLRDLKVAIQEEEQIIEELQKQRDEAVMKTKNEEAEIESRYQEKIKEVLRQEKSSALLGVVRQKRLLEQPNLLSMNIERPNPIGMKKRATAMRRPC